MSSDSSDTDSEVGTNIQRRGGETGRMSEVIEKLDAAAHQNGDDCKCSRCKCFKVVSLSLNFNLLNLMHRFSICVGLSLLLLLSSGGTGTIIIRQVLISFSIATVFVL